ncbi:MAG: ABC transporter permease, partial [Pseudomonadota bacterium]
MAAIDVADTDVERDDRELKSSPIPAGIALSERNGVQVLEVTGTWSLRTLADVWPTLRNLLNELSKSSGPLIVDAMQVERFDVSGAWAIRDLADRARDAGRSVEISASEQLLAVFARLKQQNRDHYLTPEDDEEDAVVGALSSLGQTLTNASRDFVRGLDLAGALMLWIVTAARRGGLRPRSIATHCIRMGIGAVPVVAISSFLVGGVIAQQSAYQLKDFGAETLAVDLSSYMIFRELAILIAAIMVAGRSASAIAAEIGAMKMREEVDALTVMGLEPVEVLVIPRLVALVIVLPMLTVVAMGFSIFGAATLVNLYSGIGFELYMERMRDFVWPSTIISTMLK